MADHDVRYMAQALALAARGEGHVHPNPLVGAVLVREGVIVGTGWHARFGAAHAETIALEAAGARARGATLYVTLEPCKHHGKTPPCTDAILRAGVSRVVAAIEDPDPRVRGAGLDALRAAGVEVVTGVLGAAARELNGPFLQYHLRGRPLVTLKLASSLDGRIAATGGRSRWITSPAARREVHALRARVDAVVVGKGTAEADDPALTVRHVDGQNPVRVVFATSGRLRRSLRLLSDRSARTIVIVGPTAESGDGERWTIAAGADGRVDPAAFLVRAAEVGWRHVLLEGGAELATTFLRAELVDEILLFFAPHIFGSRESTPWALDLGPSLLDGPSGFRIAGVRAVGPDVLVRVRARTHPGADAADPAPDATVGTAPVGG